MQEEIKKEMTYEEELKALKEKWAGKRKEEAHAKRVAEKEEKRKASVELAKKALEDLDGIDPAFNRELAPVKTRLQMFVDGKRYTRGGKED